MITFDRLYHTSQLGRLTITAQTHHIVTSKHIHHEIFSQYPTGLNHVDDKNDDDRMEWTQESHNKHRPYLMKGETDRCQVLGCTSICLLPGCGQNLIHQFNLHTPTTWKTTTIRPEFPPSISMPGKIFLSVDIRLKTENVTCLPKI